MEYYSAAAWSAIHAAWVCDDAAIAQAARNCRLRALALINTALAEGQPLFEKQVELAVIYADLLRRTNQFEEAIGVVEEALGLEQDIFTQRLLEFEKLLSHKGDNLCHSAGKVIGDLQDPRYTIVM